MSLLVAAAPRWLLFTALVAVLGALCGRWLIAPRVEWEDDSDGALERTAARLAVAGALLMPLAFGLVFHRQLVEFHDPFATWREDASLLLTGTPWGRSWTVATAASGLLLAAAVGVALGRRLAWWAVTSLVLGLSVYPALSGHAAAGELSFATLPADVVHVAAMGAWVGGLAYVLLADRAIRQAGGAERLAELVAAFSPVALVSVLLLVVTGAFASWVHLAGPGDLLTTEYGRILLAKLGGVAAVAALGLRNWRVLTPRLAEPGVPAGLRRSAGVELLVAQVVLMVTAVLVQTPPSGH